MNTATFVRCGVMLITAAGLSLAGCRGPRSGERRTDEPLPSAFVWVETESESGTSKTMAADGQIVTAPKLSPGLIVQITVLVAGKKEIDESNKRITNQGEINLPLLGSVKVDGFTLDEMACELRNLYSRYFVSPQVVVEFSKDQTSDLTSPWGYVTVLGRVRNPGRVNIPPTQDLTVSSAIQQAGGLDTSARDSAIRITRRDPTGRVDQFDVNLRAVGSKGQVQEDLHLKAGDVVFVPEMMF